MYVVVTVGGPINTYASHADAFRAGAKLGGWFEVERVY